MKAKRLPSTSNKLIAWSKQAIQYLSADIAALGFRPVIHFELEGCYSSLGQQKLDFERVNLRLKQLGIAGKLIPEYWQNQWEYVSLFNGQSPLEEAEFLSAAIKYIPKLLLEQGIKQTLIKPVVWSGDSSRLIEGSKNFFTSDTRAVHIPNAIQINISLVECKEPRTNVVATTAFGEYLQQSLMATSFPCTLLFLPCAESYDRFALKTKYGLAEELCSPTDISGGHQGSIALYRQKGKHNQPMGEKALVYDQYQQVVRSEHNWQETARVEHRLGAASIYYNPYVNVLFALANVYQSILAWQKGDEALLAKANQSTALPSGLGLDETPGAIQLFAQDSWFAQAINESEQRNTSDKTTVRELLGDNIKSTILSYYQNPEVIGKGNISEKPYQ